MNALPESDETAASIMRDVATGLIAAYVVTVGICLLAIGAEMKVALVGSLLPALFAGPFIGILLALRRFMASQAGTAATAWDRATVHPLPAPDDSAPTQSAA